jgi:hypothetical protein
MDALGALGVQEIRIAMPRFNRADTLSKTPGGGIARLPDLSNLFTLRLPAEADRDSAVSLLLQLPQVIHAEKNGIGETFSVTPNDDWFEACQWNLNNTGQGGGLEGADIDAPEGWQYATGSSSVILGIVDSSVEWYHPDLIGKVFGDISGATGDHATHCAGIAAAVGNNHEGIAGVDWNARICTQDVIDYSLPNVIQAVLDATDAGCQAINCSWGWRGDYSELMYSAFWRAYQMGALPIAAMGYVGPQGYLRANPPSPAPKQPTAVRSASALNSASRTVTANGAGLSAQRRNTRCQRSWVARGGLPSVARKR